MPIKTIGRQIKNNLVAISSLVIALIALVALFVSTRREDVAEENRNIRTAGFEILMNLGELQVIVNDSYYLPQNMMANPSLGWGHISLISDLSQLLPPPVPDTIGALVTVWKENWDKLSSDETAVTNVSTAIDASRQVVLQSVRNLK